MRLRIQTLLLFALIPFCAKAQSNASVEGVVVDRVTGLGVPNIPITIYTRQAVRYEATSGPDGRFRITGMAPGIYETRVEPPKGYRLYHSDPSQMDVAPLATGRARVELTKEVAIRGRVFDADGKPASGVQVNYVGRVSAVTDDRGEFVLTAVRQGFLRLSAIPTPNPKLNSSGQVVSSVSTYFPSALNPTEAQSILVRGEADVENIEFRLQSVPVFRVQGRFIEEPDSPGAGVKVLLVPVLQRDVAITSISSQTINGLTVGVLGISGPEVAPGPIEAQATTDANGSFEFPAVRAGDWQIVADRTLSRVTSFSVNRSEVLGLELGTSELFRMTSSMDTSALSGLSGAQPSAALILSPFDARAQVPGLGALLVNMPEIEIDGNPARARALPDGSFEMPRVEPGRYYVMPSRGRNALGGTGPYYASAILLGGTDVMGRPVDLAPGAPPLRVVYKPVQGVLRGRVTNSEDATVFLIPQSLVGMQAGYYARAQKDGSFELDNLPPGDYSAIAFDRMDLTSLSNDPVFVRRAIEAGKHIKIEASQVAVELTASHWPE